MDYETLTRQARVVLVEFYGTWCPHCRKMMPVVDEVKELLAGRAEVFQLDIDQNTETSDALGVTSVPTFIIYRDGVEQTRFTGEMDGQELLEKVETYI